METEMRQYGPGVKLDDETRRQYVATLRRFADALEAKQDDKVALAFSAAHADDNGEAITACWGPGGVVHALAKETFKQSLPPKVREALEAVEAKLTGESEPVAEVKKDGSVSMPRGLNPEDADAAKLAN